MKDIDAGGAASFSDPAADGGAPDERQAAENAFLLELGQRVRRMRALRGMSRKVLSRVSGISERYIAQLESGQGNVSIVLLRRVSAAIGIEVEGLIATAESSPEWLVFRDLLRTASDEQVAAAKEILLAQGAPRSGTQPRTERVALIGLRGAGKSTLGAILAGTLGWAFVELDREIERDSGLSMAEIMALYGQAGWRRLEQAGLRRALAQPGPFVLATGGGIVAEPLTFDLLLSSCFTVWLKARPEEHMARVRQQGDLRPMADDHSAMQELRTILRSREPLYARADAVVDTAGIAADEAARRLLEAVAPRPKGTEARRRA